MTDQPGSADAGTPAEGAAGSTDWLAGLPEEDRGYVQTKGYSTPADLVKAYRSAERHIGRNPDSLVALPGADAPEADWNGVYAKLGRPETADGYKFDPEGSDEETDKWIREKAHALGLNQKQATALRSEVYGLSQGRRETALNEVKQAFEQTTTELRREWGQAFDEKDALAQSALDYLAGSEEASDALRAKLAQAGALDATMIKGLVRIGEALSEDKVISGTANGFAKSPAEAKAEIDGLKLDAEFMKAYSDKQHPGYAAANARMQGLFQSAFPS